MTHVYQVIEYDPIPYFLRFGDVVSKARRAGDSHEAIIADTMKLLGNSGYGKTIINVDRHRYVNYCTEKAASLMVNDRRYDNSTSSLTMRMIEMNKSRTPCPYTWDSSFYSTPRCACCSSIMTSSTSTWSALCFSTARWI